MRSIECDECGFKVLARYPFLDDGLTHTLHLDGPAEEGRLVRGSLLIRCKCDTCNRTLERGTVAYAFTAWIEGPAHRSVGAVLLRATGGSRMTPAERKRKIVELLDVGVDRPTPVGALAFELGVACSTVRKDVRELQAEGVDVLTGRRGVWIMGQDSERVAVMDELRDRIEALRERLVIINGDRCAFRGCRKPLDPDRPRKSKTLYCPGGSCRAAEARAREARSS